MLVYLSTIHFLVHKVTGRPTDFKAIFAALFAFKWLVERNSFHVIFRDSIHDFVTIYNFPVIFVMLKHLA